MGTVKILLCNRNVIFLLALLFGLAIPFALPVTRYLILPALAIAMTLATMEIGSEGFRTPRSLLFPALIGISMNYIILGNVIIGLSALIIRNDTIWTGFVLLAAVPPAIAVIPFTTILRGNTVLSLFGTVGAYVGALAIMPLIAVGLLGTATFDPFKLLLTIIVLIVIPLLLSRLIIEKGWRGWIDPYRGTITNWTFFIALYTMIGLNRTILLSGASIILPILAILITATFILGFLIDWVCGLFHISRETKISLVLLGTLKNQATAGGLAITFFSQEAALPAALSTVIMIAYFLWLDFKKRWD